MQLHKMSLILVLLLEKLFKVIIQASNRTEFLFSASFLINFRKFGFLVTLEILTSKYVVQTMSRQHFFGCLKKFREKNEFSLKIFVLEPLIIMHYEARFLNLRVFLSFPQSHFMFTVSILTCATAFFARFHFFEKGCKILE